MRYSVERILHQLIFHRKRYLFLWLELLAGMLVLSICTNLLCTSRNILEEYEKAAEYQWVDLEEQKEYSVEELMAGELPSDYIAFDYGEYLKLAEKYREDLEMAYVSRNSLTAFMEAGVVDLELVFMNDLWFEHNFSTERTKQTVYIGENVRCGLEQIQGALASGEVVHWAGNRDTGRYPECRYDGHKLKIGNAASYDAEEMPYIPEEKQFFNPWLGYVGEEKQEGYIWIEDCVILPLEAMQEIDRSEVNDWQVYLRIAGKNGAADWNRLMNLYRDIQEQAPLRCSFSIGSEYLDMEKQRRDLDWNAWYWLRISGAAVLLVTGSMTGVLLVMMEQRRQQKVIACICGSTPLRQELEMLTELLGIVGSAAAVSDVMGRYLIRSGWITYGSVRYDVRSSWILFGTAAAMLVFLYSIHTMLERRVTFVQVLKEGGGR